MLTKRVIPCLDVTGGRVVKGTKFLELRDAGDPVECALAYNDQGADELVFLDITASSDDRRTMIEVVERTADQCFMPLTVGGGVRTADDVRDAALGRRRQGERQHRRPGPAGTHRAKARAASARNAWWWPSTPAANPPNPASRCAGPSYTHGGRRPAGRDALEWAREAVDRGAGEILLTSMDADGTKDGYDHRTHCRRRRRRRTSP